MRTAPAPAGAIGVLWAADAEVCVAAEALVASPLPVCGGASVPPQPATNVQVDKKAATLNRYLGLFIGQPPMWVPRIG
ncbi:MAG TPA: hypothetical protein VES88_09925 [Gemmatimonadaceae bacterium]|nr:hypothetical protein [Gemmatimonadaceae bacterium]